MNCSPEPWKVVPDRCYYEEDGRKVPLGLSVMDVNGNDVNIYEEMPRIVACINACVGIATDEMIELVSRGGTLGMFLSPADYTVEDFCIAFLRCRGYSIKDKHT